jgi:hypothetical protein
MGATMVALFLIASIAGIWLALRLRVFVLIPATLLAAAVIVASCHQPKLTIVLTVVGTVALLQIGYIVGIIARALLQRGSMAHHVSGQWGANVQAISISCRPD